MKKILLIIIIFYTFNCSDQTIYSGKILNQNSIENINIIDKNMLIDKFGYPSFIDPIERKYFYFTEKNIKKNFFNKNTEYKYLFVFKIDNENKVISKNVYNLLNKKEIKFIEDETKNQIVKRGLIEQIFGGVGGQQLPNTPQ